ncbi:MAG: hypothetical protein K0S41_3395 [Anaerocolumna sp.]|jgi:hypothetical protein|nr:hypothetical protein [Anaerocolumna sp.]
MWDEEKDTEDSVKYEVCIRIRNWLETIDNTAYVVYQ